MSLPEPVEIYEPGMCFRAEIREQPHALRRLLEHEGKIADLEEELQVQRRVRGALDTPFVLGPPAV